VLCTTKPRSFTWYTLLQDGVHTSVWIYFVVLTIFGAFFAVNLALAVLYLHFTQAQVEIEVEKEEAAATLSRIGGLKEPPPIETKASIPSLIERFGPFAKVLALCKLIQRSTYFEGLTMILILINTITMASEHYGMSEKHVEVWDTCAPLVCACLQQRPQKRTQREYQRSRASKLAVQNRNN
jgi:hypothetical protein